MWDYRCLHLSYAQVRECGWNRGDRAAEASQSGTDGMGARTAAREK